MVHTTPTQVLVTTPLQPLVFQLSGALAHGVTLIEQCLHDEPTPQKRANVAWELRTLLREVGRRIRAWVLHRLEPAHPAEAPSRLWLAGRFSRRRRQSHRRVATLCGTVEVWRYLYAPLERGVRSMHPLARRRGSAAESAPPAVAERVGRWAAEHPQRQVLDMWAEDHQVQWSCTALRQFLLRLSAGMDQHRHAAQVDHVVRWLAQARASQGPWRPTLAVGRDGICVPLRQGVFPEGATATGSVLDRQGKRVGTVSLGPRPESGQGTLTAQWSTRLQDLLRQVESQGRRWVSVTAEGYHPSDSSHRGWKQLHDPRRPWRRLAWRRMIASSHACQYMQPLADGICGAGAAAQPWAKRMRTQGTTQAEGGARV